MKVDLLKIKESDSELFNFLYGLYMFECFDKRDFSDINENISDRVLNADMKEALYLVGIFPRKDYTKMDWENGIVLQDTTRYLVRHGSPVVSLPRVICFSCWLITTLRTKVLSLDSSRLLLTMLGTTLRELLELMPKDDMEKQLELLAKASFDGYFYDKYVQKADELFGKCINQVMLHIVREGLKRDLSPQDFTRINEDVYEVLPNIRIIFLQDGTYAVRSARG